MVGSEWRGVPGDESRRKLSLMCGFSVWLITKSDASSNIAMIVCIIIICCGFGLSGSRRKNLKQVGVDDVMDDIKLQLCESDAFDIMI